MAPYTLSRSQADYFLTGLTSDPPVRHDGRQLLHFRPVEVEAGVAPHANGSASVNLGGTSVLCAITAEVTAFSEDSDEEDDDDDNGDGQVPSSRNRGKIVASVECSQALQHTFDSRHLETISTTLTALLTSLFSSAKSSPIPLAQLIVIPNAKRWTVTVQVHIDSLSGGNAYDAVFAAVFSALYDTRIPLTRGVAFQAPVTNQAAGGQGAFENAQGDLDQLGIKGLVKSKSKFAKGTAYANAGAGANQSKIVDFELENNYDDGYPLAGREDVPVCVTVNFLPKTFLLDPTLDEETCIPSRVHVVASRNGRVHAVQTEGTAEIGLDRVGPAVELGASRAAQLCAALQAKLMADAAGLSQDEDGNGNEDGDDDDGDGMDVDRS